MKAVLLVGALLMTPGIAAAQSAEDWAAEPRTSWGVPNLQGVWDFRTATPLERPDELAGKATLTDQEAARFEQTFARGLGGGDFSGLPGADATETELWTDHGTELMDGRTSLIVDPPDGRIPERTPVGQQRNETFAAFYDRPAANGAEDRHLGERCIASGGPVEPFPAFNYLQLFQTPDHVVIVQEFVHEARVVPLDGRPRLPQSIRQWQGDARGHWEGDTLVVETTNFADQKSLYGSGPNMRLVERFTRVNGDTLRYEFTVDDPESFVSSWSAVLSMKLSNGRIYEVACHEWNYSMPLILSSARAEERVAAASR